VEKSQLNQALKDAAHLYARDRTLSPAWDDWTDRLRISSQAGNHEWLVSSAYTTFCRTLRRLRQECAPEDIDDLKYRSSELLRDRLDVLVSNSSSPGRQSYDSWHKATCTKLCNIWEPLFHMNWGQAQK